jgi:uncharacterized membrane protein
MVVVQVTMVVMVDLEDPELVDVVMLAEEIIIFNFQVETQQEVQVAHYFMVKLADHLTSMIPVTEQTSHKWVVVAVEVLQVVVEVVVTVTAVTVHISHNLQHMDILADTLLVAVVAADLDPH